MFHSCIIRDELIVEILDDRQFYRLDIISLWGGVLAVVYLYYL